MVIGLVDCMLLLLLLLLLPRLHHARQEKKAQECPSALPEVNLIRHQRSD